jgi:hypothetical protein
MRKLLAILGLCAASVAAPAVAKDHPATSHKCVAHNVSYRVNGTLVSSNLTKGAHGRYSGTITVLVKTANNVAKPDKGMTKTYTLINARVHFGHGVDKTNPAAGSRVQVQGQLTALSKRCNQTYFIPTLTVKRVDILAKRHSKP